MALTAVTRFVWQSWAARVLSSPVPMTGGASRLPPAPDAHRAPERPGVTFYGAALKPTVEQFEQLALEQLDTLYRVARRLTRDANRAEDLVQETYVRALRARETFDLTTHGIRPWLLRIMHNVNVSRAEREVRQPTA